MFFVLPSIYNIVNAITIELQADGEKVSRRRWSYIESSLGEHLVFPGMITRTR